MKKIYLLLSTTALGLFGATEPLHVNMDIYTNKSFLNKTFSLSQSGEISTKVPLGTTLENIRYKVDKECKIDKNILSNSIKKLNPNIEILRNKKAQKTNELEALKAKDKLLKTLSLESVEDFSKIDKISSYLTKNLTNNLALISNIKKEILEIDKKIKEIQSVKEEYKELKISFTCKTLNKKLTVSYPQKDIKYTPFYNISANINNKSLSIDKKATLTYKGVENYENIDLNIYSYRYNQNVAPQKFYPKYLGQQREVMYAKSAVVMDSVSKVKVNSPRIRHLELATKSLYKIIDAKLKAGEKNLLHVDKEVVDVTFKTVIDAYGTNKAYLEASIKTTKDYSAANANYFLNQNPIATRYMSKIQKDKETKLYFGEDEHIQIKKKLVKTLDEKTFFTDKKISTQKWEYLITNKKPYLTKISFINRVPVSKDADIKVKVIEEPKANLQDAKGKIIWNFSLKANESKKILFGYEISNSK